MIPRTKQKINSSGNDRKSGGIPARPRQAFHQLAFAGKDRTQQNGTNGQHGSATVLNYEPFWRNDGLRRSMCWSASVSQLRWFVKNATTAIPVVPEILKTVSLIHLPIAQRNLFKPTQRLAAVIFRQITKKNIPELPLSPYKPRVLTRLASRSSPSLSRHCTGLRRINPPPARSLWLAGRYISDATAGKLCLTIRNGDFPPSPVAEEVVENA
jgi:hypothetical protein